MITIIAYLVWAYVFNLIVFYYTLKGIKDDAKRANMSIGVTASFIVSPITAPFVFGILLGSQLRLLKRNYNVGEDGKR